MCIGNLLFTASKTEFAPPKRRLILAAAAAASQKADSSVIPFRLLAAGIAELAVPPAGRILAFLAGREERVPRHALLPIGRSWDLGAAVRREQRPRLVLAKPLVAAAKVPVIKAHPCAH